MGDDGADGMPGAGTAPRLTGAGWDPGSGSIVARLDNGATVTFPAQLVAGLEASAEDLGSIEIAGDGTVLHWPRLGIYLSYLTVLMDVLGARSHITRLVGSPATRAARRGEDAGRPAHSRKR